MIRPVLITVSLLLIFFSGTAYAESLIFSDGAKRVDLSGALSFEEYAKSGSPEHRAAAQGRMASYKEEPFFAEAAAKIDSPVVLLTIGMMYCPDCKAVYPYLESLARRNPLVSTKYIVRNDVPGAKEFMAARTGLTKMPSVFALKPDGTVLDGAYVETPKKVTAMLAAAETEADRDKIWDDFHAGIYDEEIQRDLISLITGAPGGEDTK